MARLLEHGGDGCAAGHLEDSPVLAAARARKLQVLRLLLLNELVENGAEEAWRGGYGRSTGGQETVSSQLIDRAAELTTKVKAKALKARVCRM